MMFHIFNLLLIVELFLAQVESRPGIHNLINLGTVDGKSYFYDNTSRNWNASGAFCNESGMKLATIETATQGAFLKSKYDTGTFNRAYWTAARDAQVSRQFTWNSTGTAPSDSIGLTLSNTHNVVYQTCVYYASILYLYPCTDMLYVLCQT